MCIYNDVHLRIYTASIMYWSIKIVKTFSIFSLFESYLSYLWKDGEERIICRSFWVCWRFHPQKNYNKIEIFSLRKSIIYTLWAILSSPLRLPFQMSQRIYITASAFIQICLQSFPFIPAQIIMFIHLNFQTIKILK